MRRICVAIVALALAFSGALQVGAASGGPISSAQSVDEVLSAYDYRTSDGDILRLYQAFFKRLPDVEGTRYWIGIARSGKSLDEIAGWFADSDEFKNTYGSVTDRRFLEIVYGNVLGRSYDQGGFDYWLAQLQTKLTRGGVVRWVAANDEFVVLYPFAPVASPASVPPIPTPTTVATTTPTTVATTTPTTVATTTPTTVATTTPTTVATTTPTTVATTTPTTAGPPGNPGNTKNCPDFSTHAQAQAWFDLYFPFYGDVAGLDSDSDGIACEGLL